MKERPILFSAPMVRAILDGSKTQTRRVVKNVDGHNWIKLPDGTGNHVVDERSWNFCPYGQPGDRLWVRETWAADKVWDDRPPSEIPEGQRTWTKESHVPFTDGMASFAIRGKWRPSIFMPRWASRILLEVVDVKVERAQEISEADAIAEGTRAVPVDAFKPRLQGCFSERDAFAQIWQRINGKDSWDANPWVWAITFKRVV